MSHLRIMEGASPPPLGSHSWLSRVSFLPLCICLSDHFVAGGLPPREACTPVTATARPNCWRTPGDCLSSTCVTYLCMCFNAKFAPKWAKDFFFPLVKARRNDNRQQNKKTKTETNNYSNKPSCSSVVHSGGGVGGNGAVCPPAGVASDPSWHQSPPEPPKPRTRDH